MTHTTRINTLWDMITQAFDSVNNMTITESPTDTRITASTEWVDRQHYTKLYAEYRYLILSLGQLILRLTNQQQAETYLKPVTQGTSTQLTLSVRIPKVPAHDIV